MQQERNKDHARVCSGKKKKIGRLKSQPDGEERDDRVNNIIQPRVLWPIPHMGAHNKLLGVEENRREEELGLKAQLQRPRTCWAHC